MLPGSSARKTTMYRRGSDEPGIGKAEIGNMGAGALILTEWKAGKPGMGWPAIPISSRKDSSGIKDGLRLWLVRIGGRESLPLMECIPPPISFAIVDAGRAEKTIKMLDAYLLNS